VCGFEHTDPPDETEREETVHQRLAELGGRREFVIEMQWLRIQSECREQHVVGLGHRTRERVLDNRADDLFFEPLSEVGTSHESCVSLDRGARAGPVEHPSLRLRAM
jgi:hypothetical protein